MELRSVEAVVRALNAAGVRYLIVGGLAVNAHGFLRATRDLDLVIQLSLGNLRAGLKSLFGIGYSSECRGFRRCLEARGLASGKGDDRPEALER